MEDDINSDANISAFEKALQKQGRDRGTSSTSFVNTGDPKTQKRNEPQGVTLQEKPKGDYNSAVGSFAAETGRAVAGGVKKFAAGVGDILDNFSLVGQAMDKDSFLNRKVLPDGGIPWIKTEHTISERIEESLDFTDDPHSTGGKIGQDLIQFGLGWASGSRILRSFAGVNKALKPVKGFKAKTGKDLLEVTKRAGKIAGFEMGASGLGTFIASDPHAERMSDFLQTYPSLSNPVTDFVFDTLESDKNDSVLEGKFKAGLEDVLTAGAVEVVFKGTKLFKEGLRTWLNKGDKGYAKFLDAHTKTMEEATMLVDGTRVPKQTPWDDIHKVDVDPMPNPPNPNNDLRGNIKQSLSEEDEVLKRGSSDTAITRTSDSTLVKTLKSMISKADDPVADSVADVGDDITKSANEIKLGDVLHLGAGREKNFDRQSLDELSGNRTSHYDPGVNPEDAERLLMKQNYDTVLSPFVMNTLPPKVRKQAYIEMSHSMKADGMGLVTVRGKGDVKGKPGWEAHEDGFIVPTKGKNADRRFQKGYTPDELKKELEVHFNDVEIIKTKGNASVTAKVGKPKRTEQTTGKSFQIDLDSIQMTADDIASYTAKIMDIQSVHTFDGEMERISELNKVFNWENMGGASAVKTLKALADTLRDSPEYTVHSIETNAEIVAKASGMKKGRHLIDKMVSLNMQTKEMSTMLHASKDMLLSLSREIYQTAIRAEKGSEKDKVDLLRLIQDQGELFEAVKGVQRSSARTTQSGRIKVYDNMNPKEVAELLDGSGGDAAIKKFAARIAATEGDLMAVNAVTRKSSIEKMIDVHNEFWIAGILGGFKTHMVNITAGSINTFWLPAQKAVGALLRGDKESAREAGMQVVYLRTAFRDALEMARKAFAIEDAILDSTSRTLDAQALKAISAKNFGMDNTVTKEEDIIDWFGVKAVNFLGHLVRLPNRFLMAEDEFFKQINYRATMKSKLWGDAHKLGKSTKKMVRVTERGKEKYISEVDEYVNLELDKSIDEAGRGTVGTEAMDMARGSTFTNSVQDMEGRFGNWGGGLQSFVNRNPFFRGWLLPFVRVPTNLLRTAVDNSPLGGLTQRYQNIMSAGTEAEKALMTGKLATGSLMWGYAIHLATEDRITGGSPKDRELRAAGKATGWQPYSFVTGDFTLDKDGKLVEDNRKYYSFQRLDPFGIPFGIAADIKRIFNKVDQGTYDNFIAVATLAMANNLGSKSYLKGLLDAFKILEDEDGSVTQRYFRTRAGSYVPNAFGMFDFINEDDGMKDVRTVLDGILAKIPGVSDMVESKRDIFGSKVLPPDGQPMHSLNPFTVSTAKNDPVRFEMNRLAEGAGQGQFVQMPKKISNNVDLTQFRNSNGQTAYDRASELMGIVKNKRGETLHDRLKRVIKSDSYNRGDIAALDGDAMNKRGKRIDQIGTQVTKYKQRALKQLLREFDSEFADGKIQGKMSLKDLVDQDKKNQRLVRRGKQAMNLEDDLFN